MANTKSRKPFPKRGKSSNSKDRDKGQTYDRFEDEAIRRENYRKKKNGEGELHDYNDVSWYYKNAQMLKDAASFSYNRPLGSDLQMDRVFRPVLPNIGDKVHIVTGGEVEREYTVSGVNIHTAASATTVPGIMNLVTGMCPGLSRDYQSPVNLAAQNVYSFVRYTNSGAANYDPTDLMLYLLSMDSLYALWNHLKKAYGLAMTYSQTNWYLPRALILSMGINFEDIISNLADFRMFLNTTAARISSFCVPGNMSLFLRHSWMFSNVWCDSANQKAQMYQFVPFYFYRYDEMTSQAGGFLKAVEWTEWEQVSGEFSNQRQPVLKTVNDIKTYVGQFIDALSKSEDIGIMSGDILKAYGQSGLFKLTSVEESYSLTPVYNEEVLNQIHNGTIILDDYHPSFIQTRSTFDVTQNVDSGSLIWDPEFIVPRAAKHGTMLNMPWNDVTPENNMVASRLASCFEVSTTGDLNEYRGRFTAVGTEFIWNAYVTTFNAHARDTITSGLKWYGFRSIENWYGELYHRVTTGAPTLESAVDFISWGKIYNMILSRTATLALVTQFDWHPLIYNVVEISNAFTTVDNTQLVDYEVTIKPVTGDLSNWTIISEYELQNMHLTAVMSEFNVPQIGSF